ncbi:proline iminopeptidase [Agromyces sp. Root81]|uniref:alpha/beta fold hydrolase n=1 Tax=Agromyces sp. Root81 TaxID=1736601 RepID=UPI0006F73B55|nr:alpha/beta fold hydrolase [Agromyces sp. Root81]KRC63036.1 proline iminopeptidase [Agromyces sp. Root81]
MSARWYPIGSDVVARELWLDVPLDWADPDGPTIRLFARELVDAARRDEDLPVLVYLQGGPGGKSPRPLGRDGFLDEALARFRVVLPDQRGTGRSTPIEGRQLEGLTADASARILALHRADSIVRDLEALRHAHYDGRPWWTLGQSYGGFLTLHYLSVAPEAITASAIAGGLPSLDPSADDVYARTFPRVRAKNRRFAERLPHLTERIARVADVLDAGDVRLPDGDRLTVQRLQTLGFDFGMAPGFDRVHWVFDEAFADAGETLISETFRSNVGALTAFDRNPLFIALQESIYGPGPTAWAAERARADNPDFAPDARPLLFTGEMVFPWMFEEVRALRGFRAGVERLAETARPIELYDHDRLAANAVPVEAVVYLDDMYADAAFSLDTVERVGGLEAWITNEFEHDGLHTGKVAGRLFDALDRRVAGSAHAPRTRQRP